MIRIGLGTNECWTSRLTRWATGSEWSHTWLDHPSPIWGGRWAVHSTPRGVVQVPIEHIEAKYPKRLVYEIDLTPDQISAGLVWARRHISADYDYGVIWNGFLLTLWRATGWMYLWKIVVRNAADFSCSEFVSGFLVATGAESTKSMDPELTPPSGVADFCSASSICRVV